MSDPKYKFWQVNKRIERSYERAFKTVQKQMEQAVSDEKDPRQIIKILRLIVKQPSFLKYCEAAAKHMVTQVYKKVSGNWRQAARENSKGQEIYTALRKNLKPIEWSIAEQIARNTEMIKTVPQDIAEKMTAFIQEETMKGRRASELEKEMKAMIPEGSKANAKTIARTEVSKTQSALTRSRAESLNIKCYIWRTSKDGRVRDSHSIMDGVIVFWSDPPSPEVLAGEKRTYGKYHAGEIFNCRCYAEPIVDIRLIKFPCKVYKQGSIIKVNTRSEFEKIA